MNGEMRLSAAGRIVQQEWQRLEKRFDYVHLGAFVVMPNHFHGIVVIEARDGGATRPSLAITLSGIDPSPPQASNDPVGATHPSLTSASLGKDPMPTQASIDQDGSPLRDTSPADASNDHVGATHPSLASASSGNDPMPAQASIDQDGSPLQNASPIRDVQDGSPLQESNASPNGPPPGSLGTLIGQFKSRVTKRVRGLPEMSGIQVWQRNYYDHIIRSEKDLQAIWNYIDHNPENWQEDQLHIQ